MRPDLTLTPDPVALTQALVRCPSVTPAEAGALAVLEAVLAPAGFRCTRVDRGGVANLYARWGSGPGPIFGFNGHTDVVPVGDTAAWSADPFGAEIRGDQMIGRGTVDMKSAVAAFATAAIAHVTETPPGGSVVLAITGDEEGPAEHGTRALLDWMASAGERMDVCLVGEPTCPERVGDMIKIGRRGSITGMITATGRQGHSAYPDRAANPLPVLVRCLHRMAETRLDGGTAHFDPSTLAITTIDTGNPANNVIPAAARATVNIRFNDAHTGAGLAAWLEEVAAEASDGTDVSLAVASRISGESFLTPPGPLSALVEAAVAAETGLTPRLSTTGGTSDARFIKDHCPVVEFGLVGRGMHAVDEAVPIADIQTLTRCYRRILSDFFA